MFNQDLFMHDDEISMNSNFGFGDNAFSSNPFSLELDSAGPSYINLNFSLPQPEPQNLDEPNAQENEQNNEPNESNYNISLLNDQQNSRQSEEESNFTPVNIVKINETNQILFGQPEKEEEKNKMINEKQKEISFNVKKTNYTSQENEQLKPEMVKPNTTNIAKRIDYCKKYFKTNFVKFLKKHCNKLIQSSCLPKELKQNISSPNSLSFTGNTKDADNLAFLDFSVQKIFCYYKEGNKGKNSLQIKNQKKIGDIMNFIESCEDESKYEKISSFFKMSLENAYELFFESDDFKNYTKDSKIIYLDKEFKIQKGFSLLEKNGFLKMIKMCKNYY